MGILRTALVGAAAVSVYRAVVRGDLVLDTGIGRRTRPLRCPPVQIDAPREVVFDLIAAPYLGKTPRAMAGHLDVVERGSDMVLAAHRTPARFGLVATTLETVRFTRPGRIDFRLVRGPVPCVVEAFLLHEAEPREQTRLEYVGELGTDFWACGSWWADRVADTWEAAVRDSFAKIKVEAERAHSVSRH